MQGFFGFEEAVFNIEMEAHFEGPHNENKERNMTSDGAGAGIKAGQVRGNKIQQNSC